MGSWSAMLAWPFPVLHFVVLVICLAGATVATGHALLSKRDVRAAIGWVVVLWLVPFFGALGYLLLGVNRVSRRAISLRGERATAPIGERDPVRVMVPSLDQGALSTGIAGLERFLDGMAGCPLLAGNSVEAFANGKEAYAAMLRAINQARRYVLLMTYIFDDDETGRQFVSALERAVARGVEVRVIIDAVGSRYSHRSMVTVLRSRGVAVRSFLPTRVPWRAPFFNLRNHRKVLVVDGEVAFTGGMNIRDGHQHETGPFAIRDAHFLLRGRVIGQLQEVFAEDWMFVAGELLAGEKFLPSAQGPAGEAEARAISDGPDHDLDKLFWTLLGGLACARRRVLVSTPYFLPINGIDTALIVAARRGVAVEIFLPEQSNLHIVDWASRSMWLRLLDGGVRLWLSPAPFDHSKMMVVDEAWSLIGSANWDPRSLRLNFELNVEVVNERFNAQLSASFAERRAASREVSREEMRGLALPARLRNAAAALAAPYL